MRAFVSQHWSHFKVPKNNLKERQRLYGNLLQNHGISLRFQVRTMSDETEQRVCDEDFGSEEEADAESYLEDNSSDLMDRLRELEVSTHTYAPSTWLEMKQEVG